MAGVTSGGAVVVEDLAAKTVVITGASSGLGAEGARLLARHGATVIAIGRSLARTTALAAELGTTPMIADFGNLAAVRGLAGRLLDELPTIDVLALNAGAMNLARTLTPDGFELTFQASYLAPFFLQQLLHDRLVASRGLTITTTSSAVWSGRVDPDRLGVERRRHSGFAVYADSKLALLMFARELARRYAGTGSTSIPFHPGIVRSSLFERPPDHGASSSDPVSRARSGWCPRRTGRRRSCIWPRSRTPSPMNGRYFSKSRPTGLVPPAARGIPRLSRLWRRTEELLARA